MAHPDKEQRQDHSGATPSPAVVPSPTSVSAFKNNNNNNHVNSSSSTTTTSHLVLVEARIKMSATRESRFFVPLPELQRRESEMRLVQTRFGVASERWNGSRLYNTYYAQQQQQVVEQREETDSPNSGSDGGPKVVVIHLDPSGYCRQNHLSHNFVWTMWLTDMLQRYYEQGRLIVPAIDHQETKVRVRGDLVLLALEFLGILYQPSQLEFGNADAYHAVKHWSLYLMVRADLANHIEAYMHAENNQEFFFCISPTEEHENASSSTPSPYPVLVTEKVTAQTAWSFFSKEQGFDMRCDFCSYLRHTINKHVRFVQSNNHLLLQVQGKSYSPPPPPPPPLRSVQANAYTFKAATTESSLVSSILIRNNKELDRDSLPYPLDELVQEDLQRGTLERLVLEANKRTATRQQQHAQEKPTTLSQRSTSSRASTLPLPSSSPARRTFFSPGGKQPTAIAPADEEEDWQQLLVGQSSALQQKTESGGHDIPKESTKTTKPSSPPRTSPPRPLPPASSRPPVVPGAAKELSLAKKKATASRPIVSPSPAALAEQQQRHATDAPIRVVRASSSSQSVTSALTGPIFHEEDEHVKKHTTSSKMNTLFQLPEAVQRQHHDWIQGSLLNRGVGVSKLNRSLLDDVTETDDASGAANLNTSVSPTSSPALKNEYDHTASWEWVTEMCSFSSRLLQESTKPTAPPALAEEYLEENDHAALNALALEAVVGTAASDILRNMELNAGGLFLNNSLLAEEEDEEALQYLVSSPQQSTKAVAIHEEAPTPTSSRAVQSNRQLFPPSHRTTTTSEVILERASSTASAPRTPVLVKDRLLLAEAAADLRRRQSNDSLRQGTGKEVVLAFSPMSSSSSATTDQTSPSPISSAAESTTSSTESVEIDDEVFKLKKIRSPKSSVDGSSSRKRNGVRFLFRRRQSTETSL